jgi:heparin binding hemagglutinin HbhA
VADLQKRLAEVQKDVQTRISDLDLEPKTLRDQAVTVVTAQLDALSKDAQVRREAIEKRVAELQVDAAGIPATVNATYADLAKRGETLVGRMRTQESTQATAAAAQTTTAKAKTTKTQATKAAKKTTKSTTKKATSTAKKTSAAPRSSAKATTTAAKKTASSAAQATTDAAAKVGD